ncbi:MAG: DapH/DapD/GlmU-related protein [candidate division WOR-3 bacterium]|nr:DapH/DapD/GlmU-related protein [candidate division WOR-3 bacterium]
MKGFGLGLVALMSALFIFVHGLALLAPAAVFRYVILDLANRGLLGFVGAVFLVVVDFVLLLIMLVVTTGLASRILGLRYSGEHEVDLRIPAVRNWLLNFTIYFPTAVVLDFLHLYSLKTLHVSLLGGKIGRGVVIGGMITDPGLIQVGDYTNIGGFSTIMCHSTERGRIRFGRVTIGRNCGVGARSTILAGATLEDGALLGAGSLLTKNTVIPAGQTWGGVPARPLPAAREAPIPKSEIQNNPQ